MTVQVSPWARPCQHEPHHKPRTVHIRRGIVLCRSPIRRDDLRREIPRGVRKTLGARRGQAGGIEAKFGRAGAERRRAGSLVEGKVSDLESLEVCGKEEVTRGNVAEDDGRVVAMEELEGGEEMLRPPHDRVPTASPRTSPSFALYRALLLRLVAQPLVVVLQRPSSHQLFHKPDDVAVQYHTHACHNVWVLQSASHPLHVLNQPSSSKFFRAIETRAHSPYCNTLPPRKKLGVHYDAMEAFSERFTLDQIVRPDLESGDR
mmetsp:Transcript_48241/g.96565  ORF Transcript_48241/g.96565 Transcript_48241/m.96565 type:complete len:261 (-) Transcript_48241:262-1044(-)